MMRGRGLKSAVLVGALVIAGVMALSGCQRDRLLVSYRGFEARSGVMWNVQPPFLEPPPEHNRTVWVHWENAYEAEDIELEEQIRRSLVEGGYTVVEDQSIAHFRLWATLRDQTEDEAGDHGLKKAAALGTIAKATAATEVGPVLTEADAKAQLRDARIDHRRWGNHERLRVRTYLLVLDLLVEEYRDKGLHSPANIPEAEDAVADDEPEMDYVSYGVRLTAWAQQVGMWREEAVPLLRKRAAAAMLEMMPSPE